MTNTGNLTSPAAQSKAWPGRNEAATWIVLSARPRGWRGSTGGTYTPKKVKKRLKILPKTGRKAFEVFVKGLQEIQPFLAALLLRYSGISKKMLFWSAKICQSCFGLTLLDWERNIRISVSLHFIECDANKRLTILHKHPAVRIPSVVIFSPNIFFL